MKSKYPTSIFRSRLNNLTSDNAMYTGFTLPSLLVEETMELDKQISILEQFKVIKFEEALFLDYNPLKNGDFIGMAWATSWAQVKFKIPKEWITADKIVYLHVGSGCEAMVYDHKGHALQCTSETRENFNLTELLKTQSDFHFYIEFACNRLFGNGKHGDISPSDDTKRYTLNNLEIRVVNSHIEALEYDFKFLKQLMNDLNESEIKNKALNTAHEMLTMFMAEDKSTWPKTRDIMKAFLIGQDNLSYQHEVVAVGNCHIDTAWLWTYQQTIQKAMRSWKTQVNYMRLDPNYKFACSQTIQMKWVKKDYPQVWQEILEFVKNGQFIPIGGSVVEMDGNLPSGEAFCRQVLYGQLFFQSEFGFKSEIFWLPDTFGYSGNLPQIIKSAQMPYFFTQKLSWNNINNFPHHSFIWRGIDSTDVIAHFPPSSTYTSDASVGHILESVKGNKDSRYTSKSMLAYGDGDGGSGPNDSHINNLKRIMNCPGLPKVSFKHPIAVYEHLESVKDDLSVWKGELYFELHRGTFTSQALNKKYNRALEFKLQCVENVCTEHYLKNKTPYPREKLLELWETVCLNQFHDVLPGSSIELVYKDSQQLYKQVDKACDELLSKYHYTPQVIKSSGSVKVNQKDNVVSIITPLYSCEMNHKGQITSYKVDSIEYVESKFNELRVFEDIPIFWDAWDIEITALEKQWEPTNYSLKLSKSTETEAIFELKCLIGASEFKQLIIFNGNTPLVAFETQVDWKENHKLLQVHFTTTLTSDDALYDIQYGQVKRPTHRNTSWDIAKFECLGHKYMAIEEYNKGIGLMTDCKYGYNCLFSDMGISLLRSPKGPDGNCDMHPHTFKYGFLPFSDRLDLIKTSIQFQGVHTPEITLVKASGSVLVGTIKMGELKDVVVVRLYESCGGTVKTTLQTEFKYKKVWMSNVLEDLVQECSLEMNFRPYEIKTIVFEV